LSESPISLNFSPAGADSIGMTPSSFGIDLLAQVLDASALRHRVIAQNIANVNTPGYKRLEVAFEGELKQALALPGGGTGYVAPTVIPTDAPERVDGNTVDIDREMNEVAKNGLLYQAMSQILASRLGSLRSAISGR
jgi:flagellar basal-body rod protein FlgB